MEKGRYAVQIVCSKCSATTVPEPAQHQCQKTATIRCWLPSTQCPQALVSMLIFSVNDLQTAIITKSINFSLTKLDSTIR
jgi:hypothetical protein